MEIRCPNCSYQGQSKKYTKGSLLVELLGWIVFFPLRILYSLWRLGSKYQGCPKCGYQYVVKS